MKEFFKWFFSGAEVVQGSLAYWRERILFALYAAGFVFGVVAYAPTAYFLVRIGRWDLLALDTAVFIWAGVGAIYRRRIGFLLRAGVALLIIYVLGVFILVRLGPFSGGPIYIFSFAAVAGVLVGLRGAIVALLINACTFIVLGVLVAQGVLPWAILWDDALLKWIITGFNFLGLNALVAISIAYLSKGLMVTLGREQSALATVDQERKQLEAAYQRLQQETAERDKATQAMEESEKRYRSLVEESFDGVLIHDGTYIQFANQQALEMFGYEHDDLIGMDFRDLSHPDSYPIMRQRAEARLRGERVPSQYEVKLKRCDGSIFHAEISARAIYREGQQVIQTWIRDITEHKAAEEALRESEQRFKEMTLLLPIVIFETDMNGNLTYVNRISFDYFLYSQEDFDAGLNALNMVVESDRERAFTNIAGIVGMQPGNLNSYTFLRKDGTTFPGMLQSAPVVREGQVVGIRGFILDLTEKKKDEEALRKSEERYRDLFNNISDFIYTHDEQGRFLSVNRTITRVLGFDEAAIIGRSIADFVVSRYRQDFFDHYLTTVLEKGESKGLLTIMDHEGQERYVEYNNSLVREDSGHVYVRGSGRDVTERIHTERKMKDLQDQLVQNQKLQALGTLASGVSHEFNNILQVISSYIQLLQEKIKMEEPGRKYVREVEQAVERASDLVRRLLTFSRKFEPDLKVVDLNQEVLQTVSTLRRVIPPMISIETILDENLSSVSADPNLLEVMIMNIAVNARDAMPEGGQLTFETSSAPFPDMTNSPAPESDRRDFVLLKIADTGQGMDKSTLERIFEPFFTTKGLGKGTGLGMSMVYGIVRNHGGYITCESHLGEGTTYSIYLPLTQKSALETETERSDTTPKAETTSATILLVDDEAAILETCSEIFRMSGYSVKMAQSGEDALEIYRNASEKPDLIIMDLGMPGMGGHKALRELIQLDPRAKVIIASGYSSQGEEESVKADGAMAFVTKPYQLKALLDKAREILELKLS
jgi:two-component system cell cycle sensor histidine kinase/response regulator CckA